jgi:hypothetical protein
MHHQSTRQDKTRKRGLKEGNWKEGKKGKKEMMF